MSVGAFGAFMGATLEDLVDEARAVIKRDREQVLDEVDQYLRGDFRDPYSAQGMTAESRAMMSRAQQNWCEIPVKAAVQALAVDGFRPGETDSESREDAEHLSSMPEWQMWQRSNCDARQDAVHRAGIAYGHAFVLSEGKKEAGGQVKAYARLLSPLDTTCLFDDPLSDDNAVLALTIVRRPWTNSRGQQRHGVAVAWDRVMRYDILIPFEGGDWQIGPGVPHGGNGHCPVTRFVAQMDCMGNVEGAVAPLIRWQDTFNQMLFNLLLAQSTGAHRILYGVGISPAAKVDADGNPVLGVDGTPVPEPIRVNPGAFLADRSADAKFGAIPESDQRGYIESLDMLVKDFGAISQTPPDFFLGQMANLSAEALNAAERSFRRKVSLYKRQFGEAWERVLRIGMVIEGREERELWEHNEVLWKDLENAAMSQTADALCKLREGLGVPQRGLWEMVPGVSPNQIDKWNEMADEESESLMAGLAVGDYRRMMDYGQVPETDDFDDLGGAGPDDESAIGDAHSLYSRHYPRRRRHYWRSGRHW